MMNTDSQSVRTDRRLFPGALLAAVALAALLSPAAQAQPFGSWLTLPGPTNGFVTIPSSVSLNPASELTIEGWVNVSIPAGQQCVSLFGKNWTKTWWVGVCTGNVLRSYVRGYDSSGSSGSHSFRDSGTVPPGEWTHVAVVVSATQRFHYINGEFVGSWAETGALPSDTDAAQIGSDVQYTHTPAGAIDEVRLWSVARTQDQIRSTINVPVNTAQPGLVAVWPLDGNANDVVGGHNGTLGGSGAHYMSFAAGPACAGTTATQLCLQGRFQITATFRTTTPPNPSDGTGHVVFGGANSGIFWFFSSDNWEVMVKAINGCALNNHYWIYSAATTDRFYRLEVFDTVHFQNKVYFNYAGPPAPAVTDSSAFATCP
jgi:hypothetical protein